jgi:ferredoxin-NADP reductase
MTAAIKRFSPLALAEALATPHSVDRYLELIHPRLTVRELRATVVEVHRTPVSVTLTLRPTRQWRGFLAGQFVRVSVRIDGRLRTRCYSPAASQHRPDGRIELTVRAHDGGLVSQFLYTCARPGLTVGLSQAEGTFTLPVPRPRRILLISGGSGITPVMSMLRTLRDEGYAEDLAFLHYTRDEADVPYLDELETMAAAYPDLRVAVRCPARDGYLSRSHLDALAPWFAEAETFVCGPPPLMAAVADLVDSEQLHTEAFVPGAAARGEAGGAITFARTGVTAANTGATLLEQAEAAGLTPEHGCRMGICFSCTQVKTAGCTRNIRTGDTDSDPDHEIQLCISVPVGDVAIDL